MSRILVELHYCDLNASSLLKSWRTPSLIDKKKWKMLSLEYLNPSPMRTNCFKKLFRSLIACSTNFSKDAAP